MEGAVVSFAEGTVKGLIGKLGTVLANEALLLGGVRDEIQYIKDELESMTAFLIAQAEKEEDPDRQVKIWMKQVREMAYDAEDCIDKFRCHVDRPCGQGLTGIIRKSALVLRTLKARRQIATQIEGLKRRTREVSERQQRYHHHAPASESSKITFHASELLTPKLYALYPEQVQPVGFDKHMKQIIDWLMDENRPRLTVISIVGFGGLGKTTLAKMAYESSTVKTDEFPCRAFVAVSQRFDVKLILADIFRQVLPIPNDKDTSDMDDDVREAQMLARQLSERTFNWDVQKLIEKLLNYLKNKRYVIILDDIWDVSAWEHLKVALPNHTNGSRIIVTTRIESVANECSRDQESCVFTMERLDSETSKELFYKRVFGNDRSTLNSDLEKVSNDILKKCGGMPLAINSIAGLLASKPKQPEQWRTILNSLGSELETNPTLEGMRKILFLSYQNLPHYLKTCFLYLSIYPEDYEIRRKSLISRWMSEGFVSNKRGLRAEEVARSYFYELINRSMVIPIDISVTGEIKSIRVHDMILEIIVSKSLEENFVSLVADGHNLAHDKIRRLSVQSVGEDNLESSITMNLSHVRSLTIFGSSTEWVTLKQLKLVRVLDLEGVQGLRNGHLKYLCKMFQLRLLNLRGTGISRLPSKIKRLQNLETLDIRSTGIEVLPPDIVKLQNLSHVKGGGVQKLTFINGAPNDSFKMPHGVQNMKSIQTLTNIRCTSLAHKLGELSKITKLGVELNYDTTAPFLSALDKLCLTLRSLTISAEGPLTFSFDSLKSPPTLLKSLQLDCRLDKLPSWFSSLSNLTKLKLITTGFEIMMNENDFQVLQKLPNLIILHHDGDSFYGMANEFVFVEEGFVFVEEGFPSLRVFTHEALEIPELRFREGSACKLEKLGLGFGRTPGSYNFDGIEHIHSLKELVLWFPKGVNGNAIIEEGLSMIDRDKIKVAVNYYNS